MQGRRWSDGLHQAVEAKEGVKIERENQTLATITLQNYFRMYEKLGGNPESLARDYLKRQEINPEEATPEQFEAELVKAKRVVAEEHKEVVAAGGLHILGTERHLLLLAPSMWHFPVTKACANHMLW